MVPQQINLPECRELAGGQHKALFKLSALGFARLGCTQIKVEAGGGMLQHVVPSGHDIRITMLNTPELLLHKTS